jgi:hypothetical protein
VSSPPLFHDSRLPPELDARVRSELRDGELLLWVGQPRPGRFARSAIPMVLVAIPFTAFALFWIVAASGMMLGAFKGGVHAVFACFPLFGLPFVLVGFGMLASPYWMLRRAKRTCYALTDQRAILWHAGWFGSTDVRSYGPAALARIHRSEHRDGSGDLIFEVVTSYGDIRHRYRTAHSSYHGFIAIDKVREVEALISKALLAKESKPEQG